MGKCLMVLASTSGGGGSEIRHSHETVLCGALPCVS